MTSGCWADAVDGDEHAILRPSRLASGELVCAWLGRWRCEASTPVLANSTAWSGSVMCQAAAPLRAVSTPPRTPMSPSTVTPRS